MSDVSSSEVAAPNQNPISKPKHEFITVVKRSGALVPFRPDRILSAVEASFREVHKISDSDPLPKDLFLAVRAVSAQITEAAQKLAASGAALTVEGIQDMVEVQLMESGFYEVARAYIVYRDERKELRDDSPRNIKVLRRDGKSLVRFNPMKIAAAIEKAFRASLAIEGQSPSEVIDAVNVITNKVVGKVAELARAGEQIEIEGIQDEVERQMMAEGHYEVAKDFIIYRAQRAATRADRQEDAPEPTIERRSVEIETEDPGQIFKATSADGSEYQVTELELRTRMMYAARGLESVDTEQVLTDALGNFYEGIKTKEIDSALLMAMKSRIEIEPQYSEASARLLLDEIYRETFSCTANSTDLSERHAKYFRSYIDRGIELDRLDPKLKEFDLELIASKLNLERDQQFAYLGLQTIYDRYLVHEEGRRVETPQIFFMRVSMGLALKEGKDKNERAIEFYDLLSSFRFMSSTPTLFNAGTTHPQLSSCYLTHIDDDLKHIFKCISDDAQLSKWAGGLGNDWTQIRATGSWIKGTNGTSQGVIPFLKVANDTAVAVNQGGKRKGAMCAYLESWHLDIEDFLELRKNTGDERRRTHDMNTANWIPDLFMKRVRENGQWTLFSPSDVPDLHDLIGKEFDQRYEEYERMADSGELKLFKRIEAVALWRKMLSMLFETGHPWITFKDPSNIRSPQDHVGVVHSSNLCTEILLNTSREETAVCNLGSVNLVAHVTKDGMDLALLEKTVTTALRMLDNVIDINYYPTEEAERANKRHRPVGLGLMGFQDALFKQQISYASVEAVKFADTSMEAISYYALLASSKLAAERGRYGSFEGSKWDRGMLPIDTIALLKEQRGEEFVDVDESSTLDWNVVRESIKQHGLRNSNTMAIAPTATISNITGVSQSIEPVYKHLFVKSNLSGEFTISNTYLVDELKQLGIWDKEMLDDLKYFDGSLQEIERIPEEVKERYLTAFEIEPEWILECGSRRQKWLDMGQSLNLYMAEPSGKRLHDMYMFAWTKGLKTTYYLRSLGATQIEKSTLDVNKRGLQPRWMKNKSASADIQVVREGEKDASPATPVATCNLDGDCESCQ